MSTAQEPDHAPPFADGKALHRAWPGDLDRAGLTELLAASAWWISLNDEEGACAVIDAIFDVAEWWP